MFFYRGTDVAVSTAITVAWLSHPWSLHGLLSLPVSAVLPYALGLISALTLARAMNIYTFNRTRSVAVHALFMVGAFIVGCLPAAALQALISPATLSSFVVWGALTACTLGALHFVWAQVISESRLSGALVPNVVIVGATDHAADLIQEAHRSRHVNIIAVFDDRASRVPSSIAGVPVLGRIDQLISGRVAPFIDTIAIAIDASGSDRIQDISRRLSILPNQITVLLHGQPSPEATPSAALQRLARTPVAMLSEPVNEDRTAFFKRLQDVVLAASALVVLFPALLAVGVAIRLDSPGPALFRQKRHGFNQEEIIIWKFRTMHHADQDVTAARQVTVDDPRVTRIGRFLRSSSIDELPQLLNVLRGEMSLVGPRPHAIGMKTGSVTSSTIVAEYAHRHRIKPGLTGWAAINGSRGPLHSAAEVRRRVQLDIDYIERQGFWFDMWIMLRTIPVMLGDKLAAR